MNDMNTTTIDLDVEVKRVTEVFTKIFGQNRPSIGKCGTAIIIDAMTIAPVEIEKRRIGGTVKLPGWELLKEVSTDYDDIGPWSDTVEIGQDLRFDNLLIKAVKEWAELLASQIV